MRGFLLLVAAIVLVDTTFFAVLSPLLPGYAATLALSKTGAGLLAGAFAAGVLLAAMPSGVLATRLGFRPTLLLGLGLTAVTAVLFGLGTRFATLLVARLAAGVGSACSWTAAVGWLAQTAPPQRRGELIGLTLSAAVGGALLGPVLGAGAARVGAGLAFGGLALVCLGLAARVVMLSEPARDAAEATVTGALRERRLRPALGLIVLAPLLFGVLGVLAPLSLASHGWSVEALGALYVVSAGLEAAVHPLLGRWADRRGARAPVSAGLAGSTIVLVGLAWADRAWLVAVLVLLASVAFGATLVPGFALLTRLAQTTGLGSVLPTALANLAWALGHAVGAPTGGWLADAAGESATYLVLAGLCGILLAGLRLRGRALDADGPTPAGRRRPLPPGPR